MGVEMAAEEQREQKIPQCALCPNPSVIRLSGPGQYLCADHFFIDLSERVKNAIISRRMILPGDRIAVALSGGKDSTALLLLLHPLLKTWNDVTLVAITVDEGIAGYREETIRASESLVQEMGMEQEIVSFRDLFGKNLDEFLAGREKKACSICGILRRRALLHAARSVHATKIATGHNLDDEAQAVLMNAFRGDLPRLIRKTGSASGGCFIPRIKPLMDISEKELAVFLMMLNRFPELPECPYTRYALRAGIRTLLGRFESGHPGTMRNIVKGKDHLSGILSGIPLSGDIIHCRECGEPCSGTICQTCRLLPDIRT